MSTAQAMKSSTSNVALRGKSALRPDAFADFLLTLRVKASPRGDLITLLRTLTNSNAYPPVSSWADLYRMLANRDDETIIEARKLFTQFKSATEDQPRRNNHDHHQ